MRGVAKQRKMAACLGRAWCDKGLHFTAMDCGRYVTWFDMSKPPAAEPCRSCVKVYEEEGYPITITD